MNEKEGLVSEKRKDWRNEIRRKQIDGIIMKKRTEVRSFLEKIEDEKMDDIMRIAHIRQLIQTVSLQKALETVREVIKLDPSLSLLFRITGFVPEKVPELLVQIIKQTFKTPLTTIQSIDFHKQWNNPHWINQKLPLIGKINTLIQQWLHQNESALTSIISKINRFNDLNEVVDRGVINFILFVSNILLIGCWAESPESFDQADEDLTKSNRSRKLQSFIYYLTNILACRDELLLPLFQDIFYSVGSNIRFIGLYFNMFLVKGVLQGTKIHLLSTFTRVLSFNTDIFLENHKQIISTLSVGLTQLNTVSQQFKNEFLSAGEKLISLLDQIMKVLNLRYDSSGLLLRTQRTEIDLEDLYFIEQMSKILHKLSQNIFLLRMISQSDSITKLILNNLRVSKDSIHIKAAKKFLLILASVAQDYYYSQKLLTQDPRFIKRILTNIQVISKRPLQQISQQEYSLVIQSFFTLSNCCQNHDLFLKLVEGKIFQLLASFYFRTQKATYRIPSSLREQCQYLFLNLMIGAKIALSEHCENENLLIYILSNEENVAIYKDLLYCKNQPKFIQKALVLLKFFILYSEKDRNIECLQAFLKNRDITTKLQDLILQNELMADQAREVMYILREKAKRDRYQGQNYDFD